jgi:hypothetical protein
MTPATSSSNLGRAGGLVEEAVLDKASMQEFSRYGTLYMLQDQSGSIV